MAGLARWCARNRFLVLGGWVVLLVVMAAAAVGAGSGFKNTSNADNSDSTKAYALLAQMGTDKSAASGSDSGTIVWKSTGDPIRNAAVRQPVTAALQQIGGVTGVRSVTSPYGADGAKSQLNQDAGIAYATVQFDPALSKAQSKAATDQVSQIVKKLNTSTVQAETGGSAFKSIPGSGGGGGVPPEALGIIVALIILLAVFRSVWAAALPIITGVSGVAASLLALMLLSHAVTLASDTLTMGALIGLGVGIDYALFIVNRYRKALLLGTSVPEAVAEAVNTSGRAVVFAGATVVIALLGVFVVGIDILTGMARGAALTVVLTVAAAITLLPALLAILGHRVLSRAQRRSLRSDAPRPATRATFGERWATIVRRRPWLTGGVAALIMILLAVPALSLRLGAADASSDPAGSDTRTFYDLMSAGFGDGYDSALLMVAQTPSDGAAQAFTTLVDQVKSLPDVASVTATPAKAGQPVESATIIPRSTAQAAETADLVHTLRDDAVPAAATGTDLTVYIGGETASAVDSAQSTLNKIPLYLALVALLGFALLVIAFRSILVPFTGAVGNLLTLAVSLGAVTAIFQFGWGSQLLGVGSAAPIESFVPTLVVGVMFGLSMDYQVFLVSRMHEEWTHTGDNTRAVAVGHAETLKVIATAAAIMFSVFASFALAGERIISEIGAGLAIAVLVDAFVLRLVLIPALMHLIGRVNWAYPAWAERITPHLSIEGEAVPEPPREEVGAYR